MIKDSLRIMAWDPSLLNLGFAIGDATDDGLNIIQATTFYVNKLVDKHGFDVEWGEDINMRRLAMLEYIVPRAIENYKPDLMVIERPIYNNLNPKTLMIQMLAITGLERIAHQHRITFRDGLTTYMPNQIKLAVGVPYDKEAMKSKEEVTKALLRLKDSGILLFEHSDYEPLAIDEHANDAVAMVYTKYKELSECL